MFYILTKNTARKKYEEHLSRDIGMIKILREKYALNADNDITNLKKDPYAAYEFIVKFFVLDENNPNVSFRNFFYNLIKRKEGNKYFTTSLGLSILQDTMDLLYTDEDININKYQFDSDKIRDDEDMFGVHNAFLNDGSYKSPIILNPQLFKKYKQLELRIPNTSHNVNIIDDVKTLLSKLSVSEIIILFYNLTTKAPIVRID